MRRVAAFDAALPPKPRIIASNVAGASVAARLEALVAARPGASLELVATSAERFGVRCAYADPTQARRRSVGRRAGGAPCDPRGRVRHRCGHGRDVRRRRLRRRASRRVDHCRAPACSRPRSIGTRATSGARLPATAVARGLELLGRNTDAAVGHGAWLALAAALDRAVATVAARSARRRSST